MVVVYVKILRVVAEKKKEMSWKLRPAPIPSSNRNIGGPPQTTVLLNAKGSASVNRHNGTSHTHRLKKGETLALKLSSFHHSSEEDLKKAWISKF